MLKKIVLVFTCSFLFFACDTAQKNKNADVLTFEMKKVAPSEYGPLAMPEQVRLSETTEAEYLNLPELTKPLYGIVEFGEVDFAIIIDSLADGEKLYLDGNGDSDFTDATELEFDESKWTLEYTGKIESGGAVHTLKFSRPKLPDDIPDEYKERYRLALSYTNNYHYEGVATIDGKDYRIVLSDKGHDGIAALDEESIHLRVDRNSDGKFYNDGMGTSAEDFSAEDIFELGGKSLKVASFENGVLTLTESETPAAPKPFLQVGYPALEMKFTDALQGREIDLADHKGKYVLLDFWATWCGPCKGEIPHMLKLYEEIPRDKFEIISVSIDGQGAKMLEKIKENEEWAEGYMKQYGVDSVDAIADVVYEHDLKVLRDFCEAEGMTWPQSYTGKGWEDPFCAEWRVAGVPTTYLIGPDGNIVAVNVRGEEGVEQIHEFVAKLGE